MYLIIGLGNPGDKFNKTRHNIGFEVINEIAQKNKVKLSNKTKYQSIIGEYSFGNHKVLLAMPQTYMNNSGAAVESILKNHKIDKHEIIVIHDEMDLPAGAIRIKKDGGTAGHRGLDSIIEHIGTKDFIRIRIGVGHPRDLSEDTDGADYVLSKIPKVEARQLSESIKKASDAVGTIISDGLSKAMNLFNKAD